MLHCILFDMRSFHHVYASETDEPCPLTVCSLGVASNKSVYRSVLAGRSVFIFIFFYSAADVLVRGLSSRVGALTFIAFPPHTELCYGDVRGYRHSWISVRGNRIEALAAERRIPLHEPVTCRDASFFERCRDALDEELISHASPHVGILENIFGAFFHEVARLHAGGASEGEGKRFLSIKRYIDIHYMEPLCLDDLARLAGLSVSRFSVEYKRSFRISPIDHLIRKRLDEAAHLLTVTTAPIESIAADVGFGDAAHFSKMFRKRVGVSPAQFRSKRSR